MPILTQYCYDFFLPKHYCLFGFLYAVQLQIILVKISSENVFKGPSKNIVLLSVL